MPPQMIIQGTEPFLYPPLGHIRVPLKYKSPPNREPGHILFQIILVHKTFYPVILGLLLPYQKINIVKIVPGIMVLGDMIYEPVNLNFVKNRLFDTADETEVCFLEISHFLLLSEFFESIDDDPKNDVH
jgi:hypothetical protein